MTRYIDNDRFSTDLVFLVLYTCGIKADVVNIAAINPIISILNFIFIHFLNWGKFHLEISLQKSDYLMNRKLLELANLYTKLTSMTN